MKVDIERFTYNAIPVLVYDHEEADKLIFINHGIYGNKEQIMNMLGMALAKAGYTVVALDAFKHGNRKEDPFASREDTRSRLEMFNVVKKTTEDLLYLYHQKYRERYDSFDILGISMGGYVVYYTATQSTHVRFIFPLISAPVFHDERNFEIQEQEKSDFRQALDEARKKAKSMDPANNAERLHFEGGLAMNGRQDDVIPKELTEKFIKDHPYLPLEYKEYDTGHKINVAMQNDLIEYVKKHT